MRTDLTKKKIKVFVKKKRYFLKTNKKIKRCITSDIHLSWLALTGSKRSLGSLKKKFRERSDYWPFKAFRVTPGRCCAVFHYGMVGGDAIASLRLCSYQSR